MSAVLRMLSATVIAPIIVLFTNIRHFPKLGLGGHAVVGKHDDAGNAVFRAKRNIAFKTFHKAVVLLLPDHVFQDQPNGVEARILYQLQFLLGGLEALLKAKLLPLIHTG